MSTCPVCLKPATIEPIKAGVRKVSCERCGEYRVSAELERRVDLDNEKRYILSSIVRNRFEQKIPTHISPENVQDLLDSMVVPSDPLETIDWLLKYLLLKTDKADNYVPFNIANDYPILFAKDTNEFVYYLQKALELGYVEQAGHSYRLDTEGWERLIELRREERKSDKAFVAMWFTPELKEAYENGFKPALEETGYKPIRIDLIEHSDKICDMIIAEIRKSGLVIADFTGQRGGVYFEAGFTMGLGIPVIWTCRDTDVEELHFDTRQYNHIVWSSSEDLKERLIKRIEAMP